MVLAHNAGAFVLFLFCFCFVFVFFRVRKNYGECARR